MPLGERVPPGDWAARTSGTAQYTTDVTLPGMLAARVLRSPLPHARIVHLDTTAARRVEGVRAVICAADLPDRTYLHFGEPFCDRHVLARDVVRFVGEEVAAVAADTARQAEEALALIDVEYEPMPAVTNATDALEAGAPQLHAHAKSNVSLAIDRSYGDLLRARSDTAATVRARYRYAPASHLCMEPHAVVASWDAADERLDLWVSSQAPYFVRKEVAHVLDLDMAQVHTQPVAVGGGFGAKAKVGQHEAVAAALSIASGHPVRLVLDRTEEFTTTHTRHGFDIDLTTGARADGTLTFRDAEMTVDNGAYNHSGTAVAGFASILAGSLHRVEACRARARLVYTNKQAGGSFRGYGNPQITFAMESQLDELAGELGIDPLEMRLANANREGDETITGWRLHSARLVACLEAVRDEIGWADKRARGGNGRGVGVAAAIHISGANAFDGSESSGALLEITDDGRARVRFAGADAGTGQATVLAQIAAAELGLTMDRVDVTMMASEDTPPDLGAWSSRGTVMSGHAVADAARTAADRLRAAAAAKLGAAVDAVELRDGAAHADGNAIDIGDLVRLLDEPGGVLRAEGSYTTDVDKMDRTTGHGHFTPAYGFVAQAVEVEVDPDTGQVRVLDVVSAHDSGVALNPTGAESQVVGAVAMGLGAALSEELVHEGGRLVNPSYLEYRTPRAADLPPVKVVWLGDPDPVGPYGAKGVGEIGLVPTPAAVANAVAHATGVRVRDLPITPDKLLPHLPRRPRRRSLLRRPSRWWIGAVRVAYPRGLHRLLDRWGTRFAARPEAGSIEEIDAPRTTAEAAALFDGSSTYIGGGTDLMVARRQGLADPRRLIDVTRIDGMCDIDEQPSGALRIGGAATLIRLADHARGAGDGALVEALDRLATPQIREMATVAGNLLQRNRCSFYRNGFSCYKRSGPACPCYAILGDHRFDHAVVGAHRCQAVTPSDLATVFAAMDASVEVEGPDGGRMIRFAELYSGPGETILAPADVLIAVTIPARARSRANGFEKLASYSGDFAMASVAVSLDLVDGVIDDASVVFGAVAPTPYRARRCEAELRGQRSSDHAAIDRAAAAWELDAHPLRENAWKVDAATGLLRRSLRRLAADATSAD